MTISAYAAIAASMLAQHSATAPPVAPMPIVPIASVMTHWDNHWYIWLPQDERFEAVEVMSVNHGPMGRPLVWVFFTERAGGKRQIHYVNDAAVARRQGWHHTSILYSTNGSDGEPRGVDVRMTDVDGRPITIRFSVDRAGRLAPGGLTDQSGHSANSILLMFYRGQNASASEWRVSIAGREVSAPGPAYVAPFTPAYSRDISTALFPFGSSSASFDDAGADPRSLRFRQTADGSYVTQSPGGRRKTLVVDNAGGLRAYTDNDGRHALRIDFAHSLTSPCRSVEPLSVPFAIAINGRPNLLTGSVDYRPGPAATLSWSFDSPAWATNRHLTTAARIDCDARTQHLVVSPRPASQKPE